MCKLDLGIKFYDGDIYSDRVWWWCLFYGVMIKLLFVFYFGGKLIEYYIKEFVEGICGI